jgi:hypothetical protein
MNTAEQTQNVLPLTSLTEGEKMTKYLLVEVSGTAALGDYDTNYSRALAYGAVYFGLCDNHAEAELKVDVSSSLFIDKDGGVQQNATYDIEWDDDSVSDTPCGYNTDAPECEDHQCDCAEENQQPVNNIYSPFKIAEDVKFLLDEISKNLNLNAPS